MVTRQLKALNSPPPVPYVAFTGVPRGPKFKPVMMTVSLPFVFAAMAPVPARLVMRGFTYERRLPLKMGEICAPTETFVE
jgi:hypothetical protein